jgi:hypothetical protein
MAEVRSSRLMVPLATSPGSFWVRAFHGRLGSNADGAAGSWGDVKLEGQAIVVEEVQEGSEPALRQFLDDIVAGSNLEAERMLREASREQAGKAEQQLLREKGDTEMTRRFRDGG